MLKRDFFMNRAKLTLADPEGEVTADWLKVILPEIHHGSLGEKEEVAWIITDGNDPNVCGNGEFGVEVGGKAYLYYKWPTTGPTICDVKYRRIEKREFGEVIRKED